MAEEDILFGKNRHLFGGIAPSNMLRFTAKRNSANNRVAITCELPTETIVKGQVICTVAGAVIRKSTTGYPETEFDGELLADVTNNGVIYDTNADAEAIYYAAFPYSKMGVYNRNKANRASVGKANRASVGIAFEGTYLFGYDLDTTDSDPATRVSYPTGCGNQYFTPAKMNFTSGTFEYGDWPSNPGEWFMPKPCMLKSDGTVDYYLDPNDYTKKEDGTASDVTNSSYSGNAMMEWPKIYTKRWEENGVYHFRCSDVKVDNNYECWCNYDVNNNEIDHFYTAIYQSYASNNTSRSRSGVGATREKSMATERTYAKNNGAGWDLEVLADHLLIQDLLVLISRSTNTQTAFGSGRSSSSLVSTGTTNTSGLFSGASDSSASVKVFGMEDWWGDLSRRILGLTIYNGTVYAKITKGTKDGSTGNDYVIDSVTGYLPCEAFGTTTVYGYLSDMTTYPWGRLPSKCKGSATTYECDYAYLMYSTHSYYPAEIGGSYNISSDYKGAFMYYFERTAPAQIGWMTSRLSYKPTAS